ncbi:unnamed protein product [Sphenostylis stenocarpa]|uniref:PAP/OAS1 substrate-binding-related domain-containing protein n=1 Tax=Sphenostylis stenocarpa TaxID=92480 RepID=A0AA86SX75_9FABA|nr:unnamed protein product [Sphenostylis stenocarpa]
MAAMWFYGKKIVTQKFARPAVKLLKSIDLSFLYNRVPEIFRSVSKAVADIFEDRIDNLLLSVDEELWKMAEERIQEILWIIEPNVLSEENRKDVIDYVQRLIGDSYGAQVLSFGSVPLKTYLPDGDIDLTALSHEATEEDLALTVCSILEKEDDPHYQVQLVKCTVKNIPVDISFNQMVGFYTIYFLEQVDQLVGKNHLFKRSIILIKAWCYYESRILGAHHGLFSTYAIEILVLYIINRFHSSLRGPLEVLYIFLDYYASFDWDNNYASIWGPRALSSLPEIVGKSQVVGCIFMLQSLMYPNLLLAETPECDQGEFLLQKEFLKNYRDMCSFNRRASETSNHDFPVKLVNILDPLRNDNNVGRCVNFTNLHRIRLALSYGARKLKQALTLPGQDMGAALEKFFSCTLDRNGKGERADVHIPVSPFGTGRSEKSVLDGDHDSYNGDSQYVQLYPNYAMPVTTVHSCCQSSDDSVPHDDMLALSTQQNWSEGDFLALQQNWSMFYQSGNNIYIQAQTLYHPTYSLDEGGKSRGTGTYIPDLNYNSYWDIRANANRPRKIPFVKYNPLPRSPPTEQLEEEVQSKTKLNANSIPFELTNEDFPLLPGTPKATPPTQAQESAPLAKACSERDMGGNSRLSELSSEDFFPLGKATPPTQAQKSTLEKAHSIIDKYGNSRLSELSSEDFFPLIPSVPKATPPTQAPKSTTLEEAQSDTNRGSNSQLFELSNEDFPLLPKVCSETLMDGYSKSFELSKKDFPLLQCSRKTHPLGFAKLNKQAKSFQSSTMKNMEFGTHKYSQSLKGQSLSTKGKKECCGVSLFQKNDSNSEVDKGEEKRISTKQ